ncbi:MAG: YbaK/EbsC family protein [Tateyamaria sp.]|uniref:YbaK/EbsC family protein n=1 Tax=Tateyamaria sp. TaxID=1929288 RepID=UPI0032A05234
MSKSLKRVRAVLDAAAIDTEVIETPLARTAADAAQAIGCEIDQIAKSIIFLGQDSGRAVLFITAGGNRVDPDKAAAVAGEPLGKADAALIRAQTGFAIGGVSPVGHVSPIRAFFDPRLSEFDIIWAAAGTPHHVFRANPADILKISGAQQTDFKSQSGYM